MRNISLLIILLFVNVCQSAELDFAFKSPAFSGIGYSSHVQTIENTEFSRKKAIADKAEADRKEAEALAKNSNLQKFLNNFESRVYAQLSTQLVNNLFGENPQNSGTVTIEGNTIQYVKTADTVHLTVTDANGNLTTVEIPLGQLKF